MNDILLFAIVFFISSGLCTVPASDWPCWHDPGHDGISIEKDWDPLALQNKDAAFWKINVGQGHSSVAVRGNFLHTMGNINNDDIAYCLDSKTGKETWRFTCRCQARNYPRSRSSPVLSGPNPYTLSREGYHLCLDTKEGAKVWDSCFLYPAY